MNAYSIRTIICQATRWPRIPAASFLPYANGNTVSLVRSTFAVYCSAVAPGSHSPASVDGANMFPWAQSIEGRFFKAASVALFGAGKGTRTLTVSPPADFESAASTNSAIPARDELSLKVRAVSKVVCTPVDIIARCDYRTSTMTCRMSSLPKRLARIAAAAD